MGACRVTELDELDRLASALIAACLDCDGEGVQALLSDLDLETATALAAELAGQIADSFNLAGETTRSQFRAYLGQWLRSGPP